MQYITQGPKGSKHISFLRRIFLKKMSGMLYVSFADHSEASMYFYQGNFMGDIRKFLPILRHYLAHPVLKFGWKAEEKQSLQTAGWVAPWIALADALRGLEIESVRLVAYHHVFSNLPPMVLKNCPVHRFDFEDEREYRVLYQLSLGVPSFEPKVFFLGNISRELLNQRVRVMLLVFLLGFLRPAPKVAQKSDKGNVIARILKRFQAKGAA